MNHRLSFLSLSCYERLQVVSFHKFVGCRLVSTDRTDRTYRPVGRIRSASLHNNSSSSNTRIISSDCVSCIQIVKAWGLYYRSELPTPSSTVCQRQLTVTSYTATVARIDVEATWSYEKLPIVR